MKKSAIICAVAFLMAFVPFASNAEALGHVQDDTTSGLRFTHDESEFNFSFPFMRGYSKQENRQGDHFSRWEITSGLIGLGWNITLDQVAGFDQRGSHSIDFFWGHVLAMRYRTSKSGPSLTFGMGIDFRKWNTLGGLYGRVPGMPGAIDCQPWPENATRASSRLYAFSLMFPLTLRQSLTHGFVMTAGCSLDLTTHASVSSTYYVDDVKYSQSWDGFQHNTVGFSVLGALQWHDIGAFVRYTPTSPAKVENGVNFKTVTVGISLAW